VRKTSLQASTWKLKKDVEDNIKMDLKVGCECGGGTELA
jgi:hypothetical protein